MKSFADLDLRPELLRLLEEDDFSGPSELQEGVIPVIRRGGNVVARAGSGAGVTLSISLGFLDRLAGEERAEDLGGPRALILAPTPDSVDRTAGTVARYAEPLELSVAAARPGWPTPAGEVDAFIATPGELLARVQTSRVKLDGVLAAAVHGASAMHALGEFEELETLLDQLPKESQRVLFSDALTKEVEELAERRVKRALRWPPEPARVAPAQGGREPLRYELVLAAEKTAALARLLDSRPGSVAVFTRTHEGAAVLAELLAQRGFAVGEAPGEGVQVVVLAASAGEGEKPDNAFSGRISADVPTDVRTLLGSHPHGGDNLVLVEPHRLDHLREIARRAGFEPVSVPTPREKRKDDLDSFRSELSRALQEEDLAAQLLVLEPLLREHAAAEVAAAAAALLRRRPAPAVTEQAPPSAPPAPERWTRLFVSVGDRDSLRPGDVVGAIAGEANLPGSHVGKVEIRDTFTLVEVLADDAEKVIQALNGTTLRGRSVRADYHRQQRPPGRRPTTRGRGR